MLPDLLATEGPLTTDPAGYSVQYTRTQSDLVRTVKTKLRIRSTIPIDPKQRDAEYDWSWLRAKRWPSVRTPRGALTIADLFCGSGGLSLGAFEAARALGLRLNSVFAIDNDQDAVDTYMLNFQPSLSHCLPIEELIDGELNCRSTERERILLKQIQQLDLLVAGPPCQGHSDLNNHTRRNDPRNELLLRVVRFAELTSPQHIVIENVQGIRHDHSGVFQKAERCLDALGYQSATFLLEGSEFGLPQRRRRCFLLASRTSLPNLARIRSTQRASERSFDWACADLQNVAPIGTFDTAAKVFPENQRRMNYLIENDLYDLPNDQRPDCHRLKNHDYKAVYGRLYADRPAPTITTGFGSPGQGRFTHPRAPRTLTPHEAARLQFFPDFFRFGTDKRKRLQKLIGNAVPPKMGFVAVMDMLANG